MGGQMGFILLSFFFSWLFLVRLVREMTEN